MLENRKPLLNETEILEETKQEIAEFQKRCKQWAREFNHEVNEADFLPQEYYDKFEEFTRFLFDLAKPDHWTTDPLANSTSPHEAPEAA